MLASEYKNQQSVYCDACKLALENAEAWLEIAESAIQQKYYGQAYSVTITANEELGKAYISWLACQGYLPLNDTLLKDVYQDHYTKTIITLFFHFEVAFQEALRSGILDWEDALNAVVTVREEEVVQNLLNHADEIENRRRDGMYVNLVRDEHEQIVGAKSPKDIPKERAQETHETVSSYLRSVRVFIDAVEEHKNVREWFETLIRENEN